MGWERRRWEDEGGEGREGSREQTRAIAIAAVAVAVAVTTAREKQEEFQTSS